EAWSLLFDVRRSKIDRGATAWPIIAAICDRSRDAVPAFFHRGVRQSDNHNVRVAASPVHFDLHLVCIHAVNGSGIDFRQHRATKVSETEAAEKRQIPSEPMVLTRPKHWEPRLISDSSGDCRPRMVVHCFNLSGHQIF